MNYQNTIRDLRSRRNDLLEELSKIEMCLDAFGVSPPKTKRGFKSRKGSSPDVQRAILQTIIEYGEPISTKSILHLADIPSITTAGGVRHVIRYLEDENLVTETTGQTKYRKYAPTQKALDAYAERAQQ